MMRRIALLSLLPWLSGCVVVHHKHTLFDFGEFAGPLTDSGLAGRLMVIAACSGGLGGIVVWLAMKARRRGTGSALPAAPQESPSP